MTPRPEAPSDDLLETLKRHASLAENGTGRQLFAEAATEIQRSWERLEMWASNDAGDKIFLAHGPDGIECRDTEIRLQEQRIAELKQALTAERAAHEATKARLDKLLNWPKTHLQGDGPFMKADVEALMTIAVAAAALTGAAERGEKR